MFLYNYVPLDILFLLIFLFQDFRLLVSIDRLVERKERRELYTLSINTKKVGFSYRSSDLPRNEGRGKRTPSKGKRDHGPRQGASEERRE